MGRIISITGPLVSVEKEELKLFERVFVGQQALTGEVIRLEEERAIVQVYENTRGLALGEPARGTGTAFTVRLGPGLVSGIFDGLQRPLTKIRSASGPFITPGTRMPALDTSRKWRFCALKKVNDPILPGEIIGYFQEGHIRHPVFFKYQEGGRLTSVIDEDIALQEPVGTVDEQIEIFGFHDWPVRIPRPVRKKLPPSKPLLTGVRGIDFLFSIARGGTAILPGGFGTGKTILEQSIAKFADIDIVVYVGCGERGNEMAEMMEEFEALKDPWSGRKLMKRTILCINTSNMPVAAREASIFTAISMAEYYRDMGLHVLFLADSISRWAEALREISSALEEMPGEEGYPTTLASRVSAFMERAGVVETISGEEGSLTIMLAVSPPGGDITEPVTQACLRTSGAFLMLDTSLAHRRHFPSINWFDSYSLYTDELLNHFSRDVSDRWEAARAQCREILQKEDALKEVAEIVGFEGLQEQDRLIMKIAEEIRTQFLCQNAYTDDAFSSPKKTFAAIRSILDRYDSAAGKLIQGDSQEGAASGDERGLPTS